MGGVGGPGGRVVLSHRACKRVRHFCTADYALFARMSFGSHAKLSDPFAHPSLLGFVGLFLLGED